MSQRIEQLNALVQKEVATILLKHVEFSRSMFVTVSRVQVADDAESAKVWLSVLPAVHEDDVLKIVKARIADIQSLLNKTLVMKFVPKLTFFIDHANEQVARITQVLDTLTSNDLGLSLDAEKVEQERVERDEKKSQLGLQPGQALSPRKPRSAPKTT